MKKEIKKQNKISEHQESHELRVGNFIFNTSRTVKENLTRLCQTSVRQRNVVLNQIQKMISTGELQGYQTCMDWGSQKFMVCVYWLQ